MPRSHTKTKESASRRRSARVLRWFCALLLLPFCIGGSITVLRLVRETGSIPTFWIALLSGAMCWILIFLRLPKPMWLYVVGHELTHAVWTWGFGGSVKSFRASSKGGHVTVTRSNFLVVLAPYFFPLYAMLWAGCFALGNALWNWQAWIAVFHFGLGVTYAFHATLTLYILRIRQPDLESEGWMFSVIVIWLGNVLILVVGIPLLTQRLTIVGALAWMLEDTAQVFRLIGAIF